MVQENVSLSKILVVSSMVSLTEISKKLKQKQFHTSTSKFQQNSLALTQVSLILVIHTLMLLNGKLKQKILLDASSKTSQNTKETKLVKHLLLQVHSSNIDRNSYKLFVGKESLLVALFCCKKWTIDYLEDMHYSIQKGVDVLNQL